jgi:hypothetical protein
MTFWNASQITHINTGYVANDSTGDPIRTAFTEVNTNLGNISVFLSERDGPVEFDNANIAHNFNSNFSNLNNLFVANATGTTANFTGNITANNLIATTGLYSQGTFYSGNILPITSGMYNLGSPTQRFDTVYVRAYNATSEINQTTDAGLLLIHANSSANSDVGILGNVYDNDSDIDTNSYVFFGYELESDNFVYKFTPNNASVGNNIVINGTYGGAQFGNLFLSNPTASTSTSTGALVVGGGAGVAGNINAGGDIRSTGNLYARGYLALTTNTPGLTSYSGSTITTLVVVGAVPSTLPGNGALIVSYGGLGVSGNINAGGNITAPGFIGNVYTSAQPYITSLGTITSDLTIGAGSYLRGNIQATTIGVGTLTVSSTLNLSGAGITNLNSLTVNSLTVTANAAAGNIVASGFYYANGSPLLSTLVTNSTFSSLQANVGTLYLGNISTNANLGAFQTYANVTISGLSANANNANVNTVAYLATTSITVGGNILPTGNLTSNIGSTSKWWNNIYGTAIHAQYADLAERYASDADYAPGTVVVFGGDQEITVTEQLGDERVAGAISTDPAYLMNGASDGLAVALRGKVPVKLFGPVTKGDSLVTHYKAGYAISVGRDRTYGQAVFAKSLETNLDPGEKIVMAVII